MENEIDLKKCRISDSFWASRQELVRTEAIPYQEQVLNDAIPGIEKSHALANFRIAAGLEKGEFYGMVFQDSDVAKWLEGVACSLAVHPDPELEKRADAIIDIIEKAQREDGYLDTAFILKDEDRRFTDLLESHELYCAGHMMEAAVAYFEATGKSKLMDVMQRTADCIGSHIGPEEGKIHGIPGHEEIEIGLLRMYRVNGLESNRELAQYFVEERGKDPTFFHREKEKRNWSVWGNNADDTDYNQSFAPIRDQHEARGHAVRALYYFTACADLAQLNSDASLFEACDALFDNISEKQMYITGGVGQQANWEGFSHDYDLPNDTVYAETCASIALVFFAHRLLKIRQDRKYADVLEQALYNSVLSGMQLDGKRFFYVNPLEVNPDVSGILPQFRHVIPERPQWYACACCPPNVIRLVSSIGKYAWDTDEEKKIIRSDLFLGSTLDAGFARIREESGYPWNGDVKYIAETAGKYTLSIHIPGYLKETAVTVPGGKLTLTPSGMKVEGVSADEYSYENGYLTITRSWAEGDTIALAFDLPVRRIYCNTLVRANEGCTALMRGPLVYCFEGVDNGYSIQQLRIPESAELTPVTVESDAVNTKDELLQGMTVIRFTGIRRTSSESLYSEDRPASEPAEMQAIPYFAWANRGRTQMKVWMPEA